MVEGSGAAVMTNPGCIFMVSGPELNSVKVSFHGGAGLALYDEPSKDGFCGSRSMRCSASKLSVSDCVALPLRLGNSGLDWAAGAKPERVEAGI